MLFLFIQAYKERLLQITNCVQQIQTISITNLLSDCKPKCKTISILSYKYNENKKKLYVITQYVILSLCNISSKRSNIS